jgi:hypothetical protein
MKFTYNGADVCEMSAEQEKCIQYDIPSSIFNADMKRRAVWVVQNLFNKSLLFMKRKLASQWAEMGVSELPPTDAELAQLIVSKVAPANSYQDSVLAVDGVDLYTVSALTKQLIDVGTARNADDLIAKGIAGIFAEKLKMCCKRLRAHYEPMMKAEKKSIPVSEDAFMKQALARPDYQDRETRDEMDAAEKKSLVDKANNLLSGML